MIFINFIGQKLNAHQSTNQLSYPVLDQKSICCTRSFSLFDNLNTRVTIDSEKLSFCRKSYEESEDVEKCKKATGSCVYLEFFMKPGHLFVHKLGCLMSL